jgi:polar amino acid transport system ATP-binding protein
MLAIEEILEICRPDLRAAALDLTVTYSEKTEALDLTFERSGEWPNPLENDQQPDDLGLRIVRRVAEAVEYRTADGRSSLSLRIRKS